MSNVMLVSWWPGGKMDDKYHSRSVGCPTVCVPGVGVIILSFKVCMGSNVVQGWPGERMTMTIPSLLVQCHAEVALGIRRLTWSV